MTDLHALQLSSQPVEQQGQSPLLVHNPIFTSDLAVTGLPFPIGQEILPLSQNTAPLGLMSLDPLSLPTFLPSPLLLLLDYRCKAGGG